MWRMPWFFNKHLPPSRSKVACRSLRKLLLPTSKQRNKTTVCITTWICWGKKMMHMKRTTTISMVKLKTTKTCKEWVKMRRWRGFRTCAMSNSILSKRRSRWKSRERRYRRNSTLSKTSFRSSSDYSMKPSLPLACLPKWSTMILLCSMKAILYSIFQKWKNTYHTSLNMWLIREEIHILLLLAFLLTA